MNAIDDMTPGAQDVASRLVALIDELRPSVPDSSVGDRLGDIRSRLTGPLRVAIAGRVKAGKSTLLNALVGERLAPTDAGECTRLVSVYRQGPGYRVTASLKSGASRELVFRRESGHLDVELGDLDDNDVAHLEVDWPTSTLATTTLIDTPGLASANDDNSRRTREFLTGDSIERGTEADAVIYLMRHAHRSDIDFLDAFMDRSVTAASPVNAVAVLSRADEIGAGRLDAMDSARRIAARYATDAQLHALCATVVPLAGLLAETALTWREDEMADLRTIAAVAPEMIERSVLSGDHFCAADTLTEVSAARRRALLDRLGLYGLRMSLDAMQRGTAVSATDLAAHLLDWSGLAELRIVLDRHFAPRARTLQARSALASLRGLARGSAGTHRAFAADLDRRCEQIESTAIDFGRLRAAHLLRTSDVRFSPGDRADLDRLLLATTLGEGLGVGAHADGPELQRAAADAVSRWRDPRRRPDGDPPAGRDLRHRDPCRRDRLRPLSPG